MGKKKKEYYYYQQKDNNINVKKAFRRKTVYFRNRIWGAIVLALLFFVLVIGNVTIHYKGTRNDAIRAEVIRVVDGDTLILHMNGQDIRVRLIGVDSPESVSEVKEENTIYGQYASDFTKSRLKQGMLVYITYDLERVDQYGRSLVYVWTGEHIGNLDFLFQKQLLEEGYAIATSYEPNTMYAVEFYNVMKKTMEEKKGLWAYDDFYKEYANIIYP